MKFVADLHLHSKYSRAVSQAMNLVNMHEWAKKKGINVLGTGDFTHPFWFEQLKNELVESGNGLYQFKNAKDDVYFMLTSEISSIYSQGGKVRRIHNLFFFPSLDSVSKFSDQLRRKNCNLRSDGRPIVGISSKELARLAFEVDEKVLVVPAHAWTPWFSLYGSFSGFDSVEECFGDMAQNIWAIETGLSSDPAMNWQIGDLDKRAIISSSDAHSLEKMGREATVFEADEVSYEAIHDALTGSVSGMGPAARYPRPTSSLHTSLEIKSNISSDAAGARRGSPTRVTHSDPRIAFTIEFYPEEGKYHFTGHRDCNYSQSPDVTKKEGTVCPVCKRQLTVGVMHRVEALKSQIAKARTEEISGIKWIKSEEKRPPYVCLVPLYEIIAEAFGVSPNTKKVSEMYHEMVSKLGSEFGILLKATDEEIGRIAPPKVLEGIQKVRRGNIKIEAGYDGKFGIVKIWDKEEEAIKENNLREKQLNLFA